MEAEVAMAVIVAPLLVVPTGTGGGFLLLGGAGAGLRTLWLTDAVEGMFKELDEDGLGCCAKTLFSGWSVTVLVTSSTELAFSRCLDAEVVAAARLVVLSVLERMYAAFTDLGEGSRGDVGLCMLSTLLWCFITFSFGLSALEAGLCSTSGEVGAREDTVSCVVDAMMS